jgi:hypothetical protein
VLLRVDGQAYAAERVGVGAGVVRRREMPVGKWGDRLSRPVVIGGIGGVILTFWFRRSGTTFRERLTRSAQFAFVVALVLGLCAVVHWRVEKYFAGRDFVLDQSSSTSFGLFGGGRKSIWMHRWLAIVWPAVAVVVAILLSNLPTRPLRRLAIVGLIGVNLAQYAARLVCDTEPPFPCVIADIIAARDNRSVLTFVEVRYRGASPGTGSILDWAGEYYLRRATGVPTSPDDFGDPDRLGDLLNIHRDASPRGVTGALAQNADAKRLVVWTDHRPAEPIDDDDLPCVSAPRGNWSTTTSTRPRVLELGRAPPTPPPGVRARHCQLI